MDRENLDLELSLAAMNIEDQEHRSGTDQTSSSVTPSTVEHASAAIFDEDSNNEDQSFEFIVLATSYV